MNDMKILLIGNFAPPYEDENIHNFLFLRRLKEEGHECSVINISEYPSKDNEVIDAGNYVDFSLKVIRHSWRKDVVHFLTKGYTRLVLLKLMTSIFMGRLFLAKPVITLHSEFFSVIGQMRSPVGGEQTVYLSFSLAKKIIFEDKDTYDTASKSKRSQNFEIVPLFLPKGKDMSDDNPSPLERIRNSGKIVIFSGIVYPSFIFDMLTHYLARHARDRDLAVVISFADRQYTKLQRVIEESVGDMSENILFTGPDDFTLLSEAYISADAIIRPLTCDGKPFFQNFALYLRRSVESAEYVYFPRSMVVFKEGDMADTCAFVANAVLTGQNSDVSGQESEDFFERVKRIYEE
jgi:hypothetical protein